MNNFNEFEQKIKALDEKIKGHYKPIVNADGDKCNIISDGIVNPKEYDESEIKILWILKEPYDKDNEGAGGWPITDLLNDKDNDFVFLKILGGAKTTWYPIIYVECLKNRIKFYLYQIYKFGCLIFFAGKYPNIMDHFISICQVIYIGNPYREIFSQHFNLFFYIFFFIGNDKFGLECFNFFNIDGFCPANPCLVPEPCLRMYTKFSDGNGFIFQAQIMQQFCL